MDTSKKIAGKVHTLFSRYGISMDDIASDLRGCLKMKNRVNCEVRSNPELCRSDLQSYSVSWGLLRAYP